MNTLMFLPLLLLGLGSIVAGAISMSMGRKRRPIYLAIGGGLIGLAAAAGVLIPASGETAQAAPAGAFAFAYPQEAEALDAQDFILEGTGAAGTSLEVLKNGAPDGSTTVDSSGGWSYYIPRQAVGEYEFEIKAPDGSSIKRKISVQQGLTTASNAQCPCRLRVSAETAGKLPVNATVILFKDGVEVKRGITPFLFGNLEAGEYTYSIEGEGFKTFTGGKAQTPKNKNLLPYIEKQ
jgi:hypothetical protein